MRWGNQARGIIGKIRHDHLAGEIKEDGQDDD